MTKHTVSATATGLPQITLSRLIQDPFVAEAFARAERDDGAQPAIPAPRRPTLGGGSARIHKVLGDNMEPALRPTSIMC